MNMSLSSVSELEQIRSEHMRPCIICPGNEDKHNQVQNTTPPPHPGSKSFTIKIMNYDEVEENSLRNKITISNWPSKKESRSFGQFFTNSDGSRHPWIFSRLPSSRDIISVKYNFHQNEANFQLCLQPARRSVAPFKSNKK